MVKRNVVVFLMAAVLLGALAPRAGADVSLGVKGGMSLSKVKADLFSTDNRAGFLGGLTLGIDLGPNLGVQPELLYVRKGAKLFSTELSWDGHIYANFGANLDVDYVEVPLLLRVGTAGAGPVELRALAGPVFSFKANEAISTSGLLGLHWPTDQVKSTDTGVALGAAAAVRNGNTKIVAEGRYTLGLTNVSKLPVGGDMKNGTVYLTVGLEFPLGLH